MSLEVQEPWPRVYIRENHMVSLCINVAYKVMLSLTFVTGTLGIGLPGCTHFAIPCWRAFGKSRICFTQYTRSRPFSQQSRRLVAGIWCWKVPSSRLEICSMWRCRFRLRRSQHETHVRPAPRRYHLPQLEPQRSILNGLFTLVINAAISESTQSIMSRPSIPS